MSDLLARLAELDAANEGREFPEPLVARWWDVATLTREQLTPRTPVMVGSRVVSRTVEGALAVEGRIRLGPETGKEYPALEAAASLAQEWVEDGVPPFTQPGRELLVAGEPPLAVHLTLRCALPEVTKVQDALGALFELERALVHALGVSPAILGRPPWT